jgi:hypothetical protein
MFIFKLVLNQLFYMYYLLANIFKNPINIRKSNIYFIHLVFLLIYAIESERIRTKNRF